MEERLKAKGQIKMLIKSMKQPKPNLRSERPSYFNTIDHEVREPEQEGPSIASKQKDDDLEEGRLAPKD